MAPSIVKAATPERCQLQKIVRRSHSAGLVVECHKVGPAVSGKVLRRVQIERSGDRRAIFGSVVASLNTLDDPVRIRLDRRSVAFDESLGSQQLLYVENDHPPRVFASII